MMEPAPPRGALANPLLGGRATPPPPRRKGKGKGVAFDPGFGAAGFSAGLRIGLAPTLDWIGCLLCDMPIRAHFNTSHDKAHCALSCVGAGLRRY
jgi:hypothetical protein